MQSYKVLRIIKTKWKSLLKRIKTSIQRRNSNFGYKVLIEGLHFWRNRNINGDNKAILCLVVSIYKHKKLKSQHYLYYLCRPVNGYSTFVVNTDFYRGGRVYKSLTNNYNTMSSIIDDDTSLQKINTRVLHKFLIKQVLADLFFKLMKQSIAMNLAPANKAVFMKRIQSSLEEKNIISLDIQLSTNKIQPEQMVSKLI